jgi:hypothetical protein
MAALYTQWNTTYQLHDAVLQNRGQNIYQMVDSSGIVYAQAPKFQEDLNAGEE